MHMIAYVSEMSQTQMPIDAMLDRIIAVAKRDNLKFSITGVLFFVDGKFLQIIEGPEENLRGLMKRIEADPRHTNVEYLIDTPVTRRGFSNWQMESFQLGAGKIFDADTLRHLTTSFEKMLVPLSDVLSVYYRVLLAERHAA